MTPTTLLSCAQASCHGPLPEGLNEFNLRKEISNLAGRGLRGVRSVDSVVLDAGGVKLSDGLRRGFGGVGGGLGGAVV